MSAKESREHCIATNSSIRILYDLRVYSYYFFIYRLSSVNKMLNLCLVTIAIIRVVLRL